MYGIRLQTAIYIYIWIYKAVCLGAAVFVADVLTVSVVVFRSVVLIFAVKRLVIAAVEVVLVN